MEGTNMRKLLEVREYDKIVCNEDYKYDDRYKYIEPQLFDKLKLFICESESNDYNTDVLDFMCINFKRNLGDIITIKNYVGLIQVSDNYQIQILPKISFCDGENVENKRTKHVFLKMLGSMKNFSGKAFNKAALKADKMNLYEIFINMYLQEVTKLVKHGLKSAYIRQEDNISYCRGKLLINQQVKHNIAHMEHFYVTYDEFLKDRPENRLIKSTLLKLQKQAYSAENSKEIKQILAVFEIVKPSVNYEKDFSESVVDRSMEDYKMLIPWSRVLLMDKSFTSFSGDKNARALLFPMEKVYESYVTQQIKKVFAPAGWDVSSQDRSHYLFNYRNGSECKQFRLQPDIVLRKDGRVVVMDAKWKRLYNNVWANYGIKQADMYQMYAYAQKYGAKDVWLLYPINEEMRGIDRIFFESEDGISVKLHFVDLDNIDSNIQELFLLINSR